MTGSREAAEKLTSLAGRSLLHFHVIEKIGAGGMGVVYRAIDEKLRRPVALKVLGDAYAHDERNKAILFREARSAAALNHTNIASIYELHDETDPPFIVMELVEGESLRDLVNGKGLSPEAAVRYAREIADGLAHAHQSGVVHRDLKPDNVRIARGGHAKILDFGLAKVAHETEPLMVRGDASSGTPGALAPTIPASSHPTERGRVMGTPAYMSPEQARGDGVDARTDVFAFGVMLYEMLSGDMPFERRSPSPYDWGGNDSDDWRPRELSRVRRRGTPPAVAEVVERCLAPKKEGRYADGSELRRALAAESPGGGRWKTIAVGGVLALGAIATVATRASRGSGVSAPTPLAATPASSTSHSVSDRRLTQSSLGTYVPLAISPDGATLASSDAQGVWLRPTSSEARRRIALPDQVGKGPGVVGFSGDGQSLFLVTKGAWWTLPVDEPQRAQRHPFTSWNRRFISPDGKAVAWPRKGKLLVTPADDEGKEQVVFDAHQGDIGGVAWSPRSDALLVEDLSLPERPLVIVPLEGQARTVVKYRTSDVGEPLAALDWPVPERFVYSEPSGATTAVKEQRVDAQWRAVGPPRILTTLSSVEIGGLALRGGRLFTERKTTQDTACLLALKRPGDPIRVKSGESRSLPVGFLPDGRLVVSSAPSGDVYAQDVAGQSAALLVSGPSTAVSVTSEGEIVLWRDVLEGGACDLVFANPTSHAERVVHDVQDCGSVIRCGGSGCVVAATGAHQGFYEIDPVSGARGRFIGMPASASLEYWDLSRDGATLAIPHMTPLSLDQQGEFFLVDVASGRQESVLVTKTAIVQGVALLGGDGGSFVTGISAGPGNELVQVDARGATTRTHDESGWIFSPVVDFHGEWAAYGLREWSSDWWIGQVDGESIEGRDGGTASK